MNDLKRYCEAKIARGNRNFENWMKKKKKKKKKMK